VGEGLALDKRQDGVVSQSLPVGESATRSARPTRLEQACERYLSTRAYSLWGAYDISMKDRRAEAVQWLADQVREVHGHMADLFMEAHETAIPKSAHTVFGDPIGEL